MEDASSKIQRGHNIEHTQSISECNPPKTALVMRDPSYNGLSTTLVYDALIETPQLEITAA